MQTAQGGDVYTVFSLNQQLILGDLAGCQIHGEGADGHIARIAGLCGIAGGLLAGNSGGL